MTENDVARVVVDRSVQIHMGLGPGLLESIYEAVLAHDLRTRGLRVERQAPLPIVWQGVRYHEGFRADLLIEDKVIVEIKSTERLAPVHAKQLLSYLRLADKRLGLLVNFGQALAKDGIKRIVNNLED